MRRRHNNTNYNCDSQDETKHSSASRSKNYSNRLTWGLHQLFNSANKRSKVIITLCLILSFLLIYFFVSIRFTNQVVPQPSIKSVERLSNGIAKLSNILVESREETTEQEVRNVTHMMPSETNHVSLSDLNLTEDSFLRTLKSSLIQDSKSAPGKGLLPYKEKIRRNGKRRPEVPNILRIGILAPPGFLTTTVTKWIVDYLSQTQDLFRGRMEIVPFQPIPSSHVPPYGYGKNHGWDKIIRLTTAPILLGVVDMMLFTLAYNRLEVELIGYTNGNGSKNDQLTRSVLSGMLRQYVRWHCRLSHVAAHTSVYTIHLTPQVLQWYPERIIQNVTNFIIQEPQHRMKIEKDIPITLPEGEKIELKQHIQNIELFIANNIQEKEKAECQKYVESYRCILQKELDSTEKLKAWPCLSLWENVTRRNAYKNKDGVDRGNIQEFLLFQTASRLGPDCGANFVTCTIQQDLCEEASDLSLCI
mmetsp:Transcript_11722/g.16901  ORF Transcript_11722/g.16901 Transcript_11722/m.16901 type:complete len:474 (-) Transcript_11722:37-1458(-)